MISVSENPGGEGDAVAEKTRTVLRKKDEGAAKNMRAGECQSKREREKEEGREGKRERERERERERRKGTI